MTERVVAVTGASGFVGRHACDALRARGWQVRAIVRREESAPPSASEVFAGIDLGQPVDWGPALDGVDTLVHCAGVAHRNFANPVRAFETFDQINRAATIDLGQTAVALKLRRLVFLSSVGVYGRLEPGVPARESTACRPIEPYAVSKTGAERGLSTLCEDTTTELVILRPPLIYGPRCPGNFAKLVRLVRTGLPLPFGSIPGRRHFVSVDNLADLIVAVCEFEGDAGGVYNVADADEVGLRDILTAIGAGLGRSARLVNVSPILLRAALGTVRRGAVIDKLSESITVDASLARERFGWLPKISTFDGMQAASASFVGKARH